MRELNLAAFGEELASLTLRPGLLFGPGAIRTTGDLVAEFHKVFSALGMSELLGPDASDADCPAAVDAATEAKPEKLEVLEHALLDKLRALKPALEVPHLVRAGWSAYVSLTEDLLLEESLRTYADGIPSSKPVTIVDHPSVEPPSRSHPVYKLLGNLTNSAEDCFVCLSDADILVRRQYWSGILSSLTNFLRDAPLFVVGFEPAVQRLRDVLSLLAVQSHPRITRLRFLRHDACLNDPTVKGILRKFDVAVVDANLRELCERLPEFRSARLRTVALAPEKTAYRMAQDLASNYDSPVAVVPHFAEAPLLIKHTNS